MGFWIVVAGVVVIVAVVGRAVVLRRGTDPVSAAASAPGMAAAPAQASPMGDLEAVLSQLTDRDGRPIRERLDAESDHVDRLRDPDDTGPLLRRALDSIARTDPPDAPGSSSSPTAGPD